MENTISLYILIKHDSLFLNLFIASELNWKEKGIKIRTGNNIP